MRTHITVKPRRYVPTARPVLPHLAVREQFHARHRTQIRQILRNSSIQAKLTVSSPNDVCEQEADRAAEAVMRMPDHPERQPGAPEEIHLLPATQSHAEIPAFRQMSPEREEDEELVQKKADSGGEGDAGPQLEAQLTDLPGAGQPLSETSLAFYETRFHHDFGPVRLHTDSRAAELAHRINARAFTVGSNIVFASGQYSQGTTEGQRLLAHELTHVIQQQASRPRIQRTLNDGHDLQSNRFKGNEELEAAYDDERHVKKKARGLHVTILQQALVDAGFPLPIYGVDGKFESETKHAVQDFQASKGLTGSDCDGIVGPITMGLLDQHFLTHAPEHALATDPTRSLTEGTRALSTTERAAVTSAITTEQRTSSGALPTFSRTIATHADPYEVRIARRLNNAINGLYTRLVASRPPRIASNLMTSADVDRLAQSAKDVTDAAYGRYYSASSHPSLAYGVNVFDQFEHRSAVTSASTRNADAAVNWRVLKLLNGDAGIAEIDRQHGAVQTRATEWSLIAGVTGFPNQPPGVLDYDANPPHVTTGIVGTRRTDLLDIHCNWPASAAGGNIYIQRYLGANDAANRNIMYLTFAIFIHEYLHTLEHPDYTTYRQSLPEQRGNFVLREGMVDYLAKIVWDNITFDASLRAGIEDRFQDIVNPIGHPIPAPPRYREWANAERMVGITGIRNAMAAFFLGRTDLIGGP